MRSSDALFHLIKSMTKGDRRNFKLFARLQEGDKNYVALFDAIAKQDQYDEKAILEQFKGERFTNQFSVAKNYLYNFILKTLHIFHKDQQTELNTLMHQIQILMGKNLYDQAHKLVRKAKHMAERQERFQEMLYLLQYERSILLGMHKHKEHSMFMSDVQRKERQILAAQNNYQEYQWIHDQLLIEVRNSVLVREPINKGKFAEVILDPLLKDSSKALSRRALLKYYSIYSDYYRGIRDFKSAVIHSERILTLFDSSPFLLEDQFRIYLVTLNNLAAFYFREGEDELGYGVLDRMKKASPPFPEDKIQLWEAYFALSLSLHLERRNLAEGLKVMKECQKALPIMLGKIRKSREIWIHFAFATLYMWAGENEKAEKYISKIINEPRHEVRLDVQCAARLVALILVFESGKVDKFSGQINDLIRFLSNRDSLYSFERTFLSYLRKLAAQRSEWDKVQVCKAMYVELHDLVNNAGQERALLLFDYMEWIESKMTGVPFGEVISRGSVIGK